MRVVAYDIGCQISPSGGGETLVQSADGQAKLIFRAVTRQSDVLVDAGCAVLECRGIVTSRFGYPNDEGLPEHALYGSAQPSWPSSVLEVLESRWLLEVQDQLRASAGRIWGSSGKAEERALRHFLLTAKEATFECIAEELVVSGYHPTFRDAWSNLTREMLDG